MIIAGWAIAQAPTTPPPPTAAASATETQLPADPEKLRISTEALTKIRSALKDVLEKLDEARRTKDVVKLNCVNEKLTQIKGLLRISETSDVQLQEAVVKRETTNAEHAYTKVTIARSKVDQLRAEAEECVGQLAFRTDENLQVEVDEPQDLPQGDLTEARPPALVEIRPPPASPTM